MVKGFDQSPVILGLGVVLVLGYVYLLPAEDRSDIDLALALKTLFGGGGFWVAYSMAVTVLLLVVMVVGVAVIALGFGRNYRQGTQLAQARASADPNRISSNDIEELKAYPARVRAKYHQEEP